MKLSINIIGVILAVFIIFMPEAKATHIVGGDINYRHIENDIYEIDFTFRRDCFLGDDEAQFDKEAIIYIFDDNGRLLEQYGIGGRIIMRLNPDDTLNTYIRSDCGFEGDQVCVHETIYRETVRLPHRPGKGGYTLAYQRCCRNNSLANIIDPVDTGGTWLTYLSEESLASNNSSPIFNQWPDVYICANEDVNFDFSATDAEGDSLAYRLYTPLSGLSDANPIPIGPPYPPYDMVEWKNPYNLENKLGGDDPLRIDPETGLLSGTPPTVGQFLVGVEVLEYRDGELIGFTRRDFQYNVRVCSEPPTADFIANEGECRGPVVEFENLTISAENYRWNFNYPSDDPQFISNEDNPTFTYDEPGIYQVQLIATRGSDSCRSEIIKSVAAIETDIAIDFDLTIEACLSEGYTIQLEDKSEDHEAGQSITDVQWEILQGSETINGEGSTFVTNVEEGEFAVEVTVTSTTGCKLSEIRLFNTEDFEHRTDFEYSLEECPEDGQYTLRFVDLSDDLNPYDSAQSISWQIIADDGVINLSGSNPTVTLTTIETITVTETVDFGGDCIATATKEIDLEALRPKATYEYGSLLCPDEETVTLYFKNTSAESNPLYEVESVSWNITDANGGELTTDQDSFSYDIEKDILLNLRMEVVFTNGCIDTLSDSFVPGPYPTIVFTTNPRKICLGDTVSLLENANPDWTYTWTPETGIYYPDPDDSSSALAVGVEDVTYTLTVSDGICEVTDTISITVLEGDDLEIEGESIICDDAVSLTVSGGIPPGEYEWARSPEFDEIIATGDMLNTTLQGVQETFYVRYTGETCGDSVESFTVTMRVFDLDLGGDPVKVCKGDTIDLLLNPNPEFTYTWTPTTNIIFENGDTSRPRIIGVDNQDYSVHVTDGKCEETIEFSVIAVDTTDVEISGYPYVCEGDNVQLSVEPLPGNDFEWSDDPQFGNIIATGVALDVPLEVDSITYYVRYNGDLCGNTIDAHTIERFSFELEYADPYTMCPGDTIPLTIFNEGEGNLTYVWEDNVHIISGGDTNEPVIVIGDDETENFTLTFTATNETECVYTDDIEIIIGERPVVDINAEIEECGSYTVCFDVEGEYYGFAIWDFGDPTTTEDRSIEESPCYTYPEAGVYQVTLTNNSGFCSFDDATIEVTVNDDISINPIDSQQACLGETINFSASSPNTNVMFRWFNLAGDTLVKGSTFTGIVNESYDVVVEGVDPFGCSARDTINISPFEYEVVTNIPELFCENQDFQADITVNGTTEGFSFQWEPTDIIVSGGNTANPVFRTDVPTTVIVTITDDINGCEIIETYEVGTTTYTVEIEATPDANINLGESVTLSVINPEPGYTYVWSTGETTPEITVTPDVNTTYSVTVTDEFGCIAVDDINITVRQPVCDASDVFIPNAFTPNGDDFNDIFRIRSNFVEEMELVVYNRWGQEIFKTTTLGDGWDGTYEGKEVAPDVYAYYIHVRCINQATYTVRGDISLLR